MTKLY